MTHGVVDARDSECNENMAVVEAWESSDPIRVRFTEKVLTLSGSPIHATEIIAGV